MGAMLVIGGIIMAGYLVWMAMTVVRGNNYHVMVRQTVIAELGHAATPYLESRSIVEQITNAFRRGDPASSTALALVYLIQRDQTDSGSSN